MRYAIVFFPTAQSMRPNGSRRGHQRLPSLRATGARRACMCLETLTFSAAIGLLLSGRDAPAPTGIKWLNGWRETWAARPGHRCRQRLGAEEGTEEH
jgi:hypothetical protein